MKITQCSSGWLVSEKFVKLIRPVKRKPLSDNIQKFFNWCDCNQF